MDNKKPLSANDKKQIDKKRREAAKEARKYHKSQDKAVKATGKSSDSRKEKNKPLSENSLNNKKRSVKTEDKSPDKNKSARATDTVIEGRKKKSIDKEEPNFTDNEAAPINNTVNSEDTHKSKKKKFVEFDKKDSNSKIVKAINSIARNNKNNEGEEISREEKFIQQSEKKIKNLEPKDSKNGGYVVDEYGERQKQERRAKEIREQEAEIIRRPKKPITQKELNRKTFFLYGGILAAVIVIGFILSFTVLFKTEKIEIIDDEYYYDDQIIAFSNVEMQQNIFLAAMFSTPQNIIDNLPYCEDVKISFSVPDTITIKVTDAVPSYVVSNNGSYLLVSAKGRILENLSENTSNLPELTCDELQSTKIGDYVSFSDPNIPEILENVSESLLLYEITGVTGFDVTDTANIKLCYDNRIKINLGLPDDINYKIKTAFTIINEKLDPNNTGTIAGTLDVSNCYKTKASYFKPDETVNGIVEEATTEPSSTETTYSYDDYNWTDDSANYNNEDSSYAEPSENGDNDYSYGDSNDDVSNYDTYSDTYENSYGYDTEW